MLRSLWYTIPAALALCGGPALAEDAFYSVPVRDLTITAGDIPSYAGRLSGRNRHWESLRPRVALDGEGEAYVSTPDGGFSPWVNGELPGQRVVVRAAQGAKEAAGRLFLPDAEWERMVIVGFKVPASAKPDARREFYEVKARHYEELLQRNLPGGAWFRHEARQARAALGKPSTSAAVPAPGARLRGPRDLESTYELFSGGRAISENLQLDRALPAGRTGEGLVKVDSLRGITIPEIDWKPRIGDARPELDPLAASIPADQHVVFFPSFQAAVRMADEAARQGMPVMHLAEPRSEDARTEERYQRQLCLSLTGVGRLLGPHVAKSVALTGSDTYFPTGTDVAVLFETPQPELLESLLIAQVKMASARNKEAVADEGQAEGIEYHGMRSPDRSVSSYVARLKDTVVVTNSTVQLGRLAAVAKGRSPSIASLPEYTFFRKRYPRGDADETALVFLSDATIRRWCGPRWRIANSRRTRDAAVMDELQASQMDRLVERKVAPGPIYTDLPLAGGGELTLTREGVVSPKLGSLSFMTPIVELPLDEVTQAEADAYNRWREGYQRNWTWAFDPIALRVVIRDDRLAADLTVMPLIFASEFGEFVSVSRGARFAPDAGDPHGALVHFIMALDPQSQQIQSAGNFISGVAKGAGLSWLGSSVAIYADPDPFWAELAKKTADKDRNEFLEKNFGRLPVAAQFDVSSGLKLTAFLAGLRAWVEQTAPGMTNWETATYRDQAYVKVSPTAKARGVAGPNTEKLAVYYAASGDALVVALREDLLKRVLDRQIARQKEKDGGGRPDKSPAGSKPWLGSNVAVHVSREAIGMLSVFGQEEYDHAMQRRAWANLPILNQWKARYPQQDPVAVHQRVWHTELTCPGGGKYVWNEKWRTMESTAYGHPGEPKSGPSAPPALTAFSAGDFGLTFEDRGLRARVELQRADTVPAK